MARGRPFARLLPVVLVAVVLLSWTAVPAQSAVRADDARTFSPPPGATDVDRPLDGGATATRPAHPEAFASPDAAFLPTAATHAGPVTGHGSLVDRLVADGVGVPLGAVLLGYSRHANAEPLANDVRRRVNERVRAEPGAHIAAIVDATDVSRSTVRYHLDVLEEAGLVVSEMIRGKHRYGPAGEDLATAAALYDEPAREVFDSVARFEPASVTFLAEAVDRAPSTVSHHLDRLVGVGLIERERADGRVLVSLAPAAGQHVEREPPAVAGDGARAGLSLD